MYKLKNKKNIVWLLLIVIVLLGSFIRFYHLDQESLWTDEMVTLDHVREKSFSGLYKSVESKELMGPGYFILLKKWTFFFGETEFSLRFLSAFFDSLSIILVYLIGRKIFNHKIGILSSLFFSTTMLQIVYAQEARPYSLFGFLVLLSTYLLLMSWNNNKNWIVYLSVIVISLYTIHMTFFVILIHLIFTFFYKRKKTKNNILIICATILLYIPGIPILLQQIFVRQENLSRNLIIRGVPHLLGKLGIGFYLIPVSLLTIILFLSIYYFRRIKISKKTLINVSIITIIGLFILQIVFLEISLRSFALIRHSFFLMPFIIIFVSRGLSLIKTSKLKTLLIGLIILFNCITLSIYFTETTKAPWNSVVKIIESNSYSPVIVFDREGTNTDLYKYYSTKNAKLIHDFNLNKLKLILFEGQGFWLISSRNFNQKDDYVQLFNNNFRLQFFQENKEMKIYHYLVK
jgi:mannosyltransferase